MPQSHRKRDRIGWKWSRDHSQPTGAHPRQNHDTPTPNSPSERLSMFIKIRTVKVSSILTFYGIESGLILAANIQVIYSKHLGQCMRMHAGWVLIYEIGELLGLYYEG